MEDKFDQLKNSWKEAKEGQSSVGNSSDMLKVARENHNKSKKTQIGNVIVLSLVVIGLCAFFYFLAPLQETLSRIGIGLMIGGLLVRIIIELVSYQKASKIDYSSSSTDTTQQAQTFYNYRKRIHGPVTITIIALYTIGFYALTPEFSKYFDTFWMWMIDGSYVIIAIILFVGIRKGVVQEMKDLKQINELQQSLSE